MPGGGGAVRVQYDTSGGRGSAGWSSGGKGSERKEWWVVLGPYVVKRPRPCAEISPHFLPVLSGSDARLSAVPGGNFTDPLVRLTV